MDILEKKQHYIVLFDCYENLLTDKQRQYFKDYYFEDMSTVEIAKFLGIPEGTVRSRLSRAREKLRERMKEV